MTPEIIQLLFLKNDSIVISKIEDIGSELGEPDCKLTKPYEVVLDEDNKTALIPWLIKYTDQRQFMVHSDQILTMADPNEKLSKLYNEKLL